VSRPGETVTVHKCDATGREVWTWPAIVRRVSPSSIEVEARFNGKEGDIHGVTFRAGDRFVETYATDRWHNVFAAYDGETDRLKGWYCNITRPARFEPGHIWFEDLALDALVLPDRTVQILDEDEFERLSLSADERRTARRSLDDLLDQARLGIGPFAVAPQERPGSP
jgi:protein associated with RNAse G/E